MAMRTAASRISVCLNAADRRFLAGIAAIATGSPSTQNAPQREMKRITRSIGSSTASVTT
jgi:hypothetical protein